MKESFSQEQHGGTQKGPAQPWETIRNASDDDITVIHHGEGFEYDTRSLNRNLPDLEERVRELESEGWKKFSDGPRFVALEREHDADPKNKTVH